MKKRSRKSTKSQKNHKNFHWYFTVSGTIFIVVALLHLSRILFDWQLMLDNQVIPMWMSAIVVIIAGYLGITAIKESCK